ncbi:MAG: hypothetical protein ABSE04_00490 [Candidatus Microgenomates bacterium]
MINFWYFVPKSGVAFIFLSVFLIVIWNNYKAVIPHPYIWIFSGELILFSICFYIANRESNAKRRK